MKDKENSTVDENLRNRRITKEESLNKNNERINKISSNVFSCFTNVFNFTNKGKLLKKPAPKIIVPEENTHIKVRINFQTPKYNI